eukprot:SM000078S22089  [mRNA]  locus=s78:314654:316063:- [translate_table: standard]
MGKLWRGAEMQHPSDETALLRASLAELTALWRRRLEARTPFQYLVGAAHWRDVVLAVRPGVLIPRPETEQLPDLAAAAAAADPDLRAALWVDLGTGSGAIAIGLAKLLPEASVLAVDASATACAVASQNVRRCLGLQVKAGSLDGAMPGAYSKAAGGAQAAQRVRVLQGDWYRPLEVVMGSVAGVVSNPPYIPHDDLPGLQAEVGRHEPRLALDGGVGDGCAALQCVCEGAAAVLRPRGFLALETNGGAQIAIVAGLLRSLQFEDVQVVTDMYGTERFVTARKMAAKALTEKSCDSPIQ